MRINNHRVKLLLLSLSMSFLLACGVLNFGLEVPANNSIVPTSTITPFVSFEPKKTPEMSPTPIAVPASPTPGAQEGLRVAYIKNGDLWQWEKFGKRAALTGTGDVIELRLSDDGRIIAFLRQLDPYHFELWAINTDGSDLRRLVNAAELEALDPNQRNPDALALVPNRFEFVPGSHTLAFNTRYTFDGPGLVLFDDLRLVNADTLELSTLLHAGEGGEFYYSPDGKRIAVVTPSKISLINADGSNRIDNVLVYPEISTYSEYEYYARPVWSPDSLSLRVAIPPSDPMEQPAKLTSLWQIPVDGSPAVQLGQFLASPFMSFDIFFSPDVSHIAYINQTNLEDENLRDLHLALSDGSGDSVFKTGPFLQFFGWSKDSNHFLFSSGDPALIQIGSIDSSSSPLPGASAPTFNLRWIDDKQFLFMKENNGVFDLHLGEIDGNDLLLDSLPSPVTYYDAVN